MSYAFSFKWAIFLSDDCIHVCCEFCFCLLFVTNCIFSLLQPNFSHMSFNPHFDKKICHYPVFGQSKFVNSFEKVDDVSQSTGTWWSMHNIEFVSDKCGSLLVASMDVLFVLPVVLSCCRRKLLIWLVLVLTMWYISRGGCFHHTCSITFLRLRTY